MGHGVGLDAVTDPEAGNHAEDGKGDGQPVPVLAQAVLDVIHGAAHVLPGGIFFPEMDGEDRFCVFGRHAHQGDQPHPDQGTGATGVNGGGHADNITSTNGGRQRRGEGGAGTDGAHPALRPQHLPETETQLAQGQEAENEGEINACAGDENQRRPSPQKTTNLFEYGNRLFHDYRPMPRKALG